VRAGQKVRVTGKGKDIDHHPHFGRKGTLSTELLNARGWHVEFPEGDVAWFYTPELTLLHPLEELAEISE